MGWSNGGWRSENQGWYKNAASAAPPSYVGPGNIAGYSGAYSYWGLRGYNAAYATGSNPALDLVDQSNTNSITINIKANGDLDTAAISAWVTAHSVTTIQVAKVYDQSGNGRHLSAPNQFAYPQLVLNFFNTSLPAMFFNGVTTTSSLISASNATAQAQPLTVSSIVRFNATASGEVFTDGTFGVQPIFGGGSGGVDQYAGSSTQTYTSVADNNFASLQSVLNDASSTMSSNGTISTAPATPGTAGITNTNKLTMGAGTDAGGAYLTGYIFELMVIPNAVSTTNQGLQTANQRAYGGF